MLARSDRPAAALSDATHGDLNRSLRHRELRAPNRFGDELRAVLADDGAIWGGLTLLRGDDQPDFTQAETDTLASLARVLTDGVRMRLALTPDACLASLDEAVAAGAELLVLPECAIPGYMFESGEEAMPYAEEIPGPSTEALERRVPLGSAPTSSAG